MESMKKAEYDILTDIDEMMDTAVNFLHSMTANDKARNIDLGDVRDPMMVYLRNMSNAFHELWSALKDRNWDKKGQAQILDAAMLTEKATNVVKSLLKTKETTMDENKRWYANVYQIEFAFTLLMQAKEELNNVRIFASVDMDDSEE